MYAKIVYIVHVYRSRPVSIYYFHQGKIGNYLPIIFHVPFLTCSLISTGIRR